MRSLFVLLLSTCVLPLARGVAQPAPPAPPAAEPSGTEQLAAERVADRAAIADLARQLDALTRKQAEADARNATADEEQKKALRHAVSFSAAPGRGLTLTVGEDALKLLPEACLHYTSPAVRSVRISGAGLLRTPRTRTRESES